MANDGVPALARDLQKKLDGMCPVAADAKLGAFLAAVKAMLEDLETRVAAIEPA